MFIKLLHPGSTRMVWRECPRTECPGLKITTIRVKVIVKVSFRVWAGVRH